MQITVPKKFDVGGITVDVIDEVIAAKTIGEARYAKQQIAINMKAAPQDTVNQTFIHELTHWILFIMGKNELCNDEQFVDVFAHLLCQAFKTSR